MTVGSDFELISTTRNQLLWAYRNVVVINTSGSSGNLIADIISTAIATAMVDYVPVARQVNQSVIATLPVGKYHSRFGIDAGDKVVNQAFATKEVAK